MISGGKLVAALFLFSAVWSVTGGCMGLSGRKITVESPDSRLVVGFSLVEGAPHYEVSYNGKPVILPSAMGFTFRRDPPLQRGFKVEDTRTRAFDETWKPVWGQRGEIRNHYNELILGLREENEPRRRLDVIFRVFNDVIEFEIVCLLRVAKVVDQFMFPFQ